MAQKTNIKLMPVVEYARAKTEAAIAVLEDLMYNADKDSTKAVCAIALLNRGWGTPPQSLVVQGEVAKTYDLSGLSLEELQNLNRIMNIVRPADEVVDPADMPDERSMKNVTAIVPVSSPQQAP